MNGPVETTVICSSEYADRIQSGIAEQTTEITVQNIINPPVRHDEVDIAETDCMISINIDGETPTEVVFESLREQHPASPIVFASNKEEDIELIDRIIANEQYEYVFLPEGTIPFGLLSVRCKRLVSGRETDNEYT